MDYINFSTSGDDYMKVLSEIPNINCGGCGIAALSMTRYEQKIYGNPSVQYQPEFVLIYYGDSYSFGNNASVLESGEFDELMVPGHIGILRDIKEYDDGDVVYYDDCDGECDILLKEVHIISESALLSMLNSDPDNWNSDFSRRRYVPIIEQKLGISLQDVEIAPYRIKNI